MNKTKYEILSLVHRSTKLNPMHRSDFLHKPGSVLKYDKHITELVGIGYLYEAIGSDGLSITNQGIVALEEEQDTRRYRKCEIIRYCITTAIAVIALFISIIALVV